MVDVEKETNGDLWFAVTLPGNKITKQNCGWENVASDWIDQNYGKGKSVPVDFCSYKGLTLWFMLNKDSRTYDVIAQQLINQGVNSALPYITVGKEIPAIQIGLTNEPNSNAKGSLLTMNLTDWAKINDNIGKSFPRTYKGFSFYASGIGVTQQ